MTEPSGDFDTRLVRLAALFVRDQAVAEQVVLDVLASSPPQVRDAGAERQAVTIRCRDHPRAPGATAGLTAKALKTDITSRLKRMQSQPGLHASAGLDLTSCSPRH